MIIARGHGKYNALTPEGEGIIVAKPAGTNHVFIAPECCIPFLLCFDHAETFFKVDYFLLFLTYYIWNNYLLWTSQHQSSS